MNQIEGETRVYGILSATANDDEVGQRTLIDGVQPGDFALVLQCMAAAVVIVLDSVQEAAGNPKPREWTQELFRRQLLGCAGMLAQEETALPSGQATARE